MITSRTGLLLVWLATCGVAPAQLSQSILPSPSPRPAYYDDLRDVLACWDYDTMLGQVTGMWEFDGLTWTYLATAAAPRYQRASCTFDRVRGRFVVVEKLNPTGAATWEWDGATWTNLGPAPFFGGGNNQVAYHETRQRVMSFTAGLSEWDGVSWTPVPAANTPQVWLTPTTYYGYGPMSYDRRRDRLVLFGRVLSTVNSVVEPKTWEWDSVSGWVEFPSSGPPAFSSAMWFDERRGTLVRANTVNSSGYHGVYYRDSTLAWVQLQPTHFDAYPGCYDRNGNRYFFPNAAGSGVLHDTHPAEFVPHAQGCAPTSPCPLELAEPWSRAWLGETLEVEAGTPSGSALLVMGFSDQSWAGSSLSLDLTPYGLTGCSLNVAAHVTMLRSGTGSTVGFALPIPNDPGLLGTPFWQQAFALAPGANPAWMLASDSVHGTVGQFR